MTEVGVDTHSLTWYNTHTQQHDKGNTMDIITITMLAAILIPLAMIGVGDAKRHPWFK